MSLDQAPDLKIFDTRVELVDALTELANFRIIQGIKLHGVFHLALTGGALGIEITEKLISFWNESPEKFAGLHLWWGDERFVPEESLERNASPILLQLHNDSPIHIHQVMPSDSMVDLEVAAKRYAADLAGIDMDLALFGVGPDGHVASLFPGQWDEKEIRDAIAIKDSPKPPPLRVSFSMKKINSSKSLWLLASGSRKHDVVERIISRDQSIPATHVRGRAETLLFVDKSLLAHE